MPNEPAPHRSKPGIDQFLIATAVDANLRNLLLESPEEAFRDFDLKEEEKELLRHPDHRLLGLFGAMLAKQGTAASPTPAPATAASHPHAVVPARTLPDISLVLTLVPCAQFENGQPASVTYAVWVNPLPEGADPAALPVPEGAAFPGQPLPPLHAVVRVSAAQLQDAAGNPVVGLSASLRQSSNIAQAPPPEAAGAPAVPPFGSDLRSEEVVEAVARVRSAPAEERYGRVIDLMHALRGGVR